MSAIRDGEFDITFKVYPNGRASGYLDSLKEGDYVNSFGMRAGKDRNPGSYVGIIAYGVGITEAWPVAKAELEKGDAKKVKLLWACKSKADTFWNAEIERVKKLYPEKLELVNIFSREKREGCLNGRIDSRVLAEVFGDSPPDARFLAVGTKEMMSQTYRLLNELGYDTQKQLLLVKS